MKKPFNVNDFKPPTEAEMNDMAEKWREIWAPIMQQVIDGMPPRDFEQDYIQLKAVKYIRYQMKPYFTYAWDSDSSKHYLERIGNEIYYTVFGHGRGESTGICKLDNQSLLRICQHFLSI